MGVGGVGDGGRSNGGSFDEPGREEEGRRGFVVGGEGGDDCGEEVSEDEGAVGGVDGLRRTKVRVGGGVRRTNEGERGERERERTSGWN